MPRQSPLYCPLETLGYIEVRGTDAEAFLQAQLGRDIAALDDDPAPLAAWHDPRGRVRALVRLVRRPDGYLMLLPADHADQIARKLSMFLLRAEVEIEATSAWSGIALLGAVPASIEARLRDGGEGDGALRISIANGLGFVLAKAKDTLEALCDGLERGTESAVELAEIELGLPSIGRETAERYLPQMLNLDWLGALSFDKGCYPGQEIIARTQNLGTVKRRLARFAVTTGRAVPVGAEIAGPDGTAVGAVLRSAAEGGWSELLGVVRTDALERTLEADGQRLEPLPLPYRPRAST